MVGYLLWVQGIPGSNPGWAPSFCHLSGSLEPINCDRDADAGSLIMVSLRSSIHGEV